jgi:K319-like protein
MKATCWFSLLSDRVASITTAMVNLLERTTTHYHNQYIKRRMDSISEMTIFLLFLLPLPIVIQSSSLLVAYADKNDNKALINDIADQLVMNVDTTKAVTQQPSPSQQIQQNTLSPFNSNTTNNNTTNMATIPTSTPTTTTVGTENSNPVSSIKIIAGNPPPSTPLSSQLSTTSVPTPPPSSIPQNAASSIFQAFNSSNISNDRHPIPELVANEDSLVTLDGSSSHSPDGKPISFSWTQIAGPTVVLNGTETSKATFTAPNVFSSTMMFFKLIVRDTTGMSDSAIVKVTVIPTTTAVPS